MTAAQAIQRAGEMRPNAIPAAALISSLLFVDKQVAEMMGVPQPTDESTSRELLLRAPDDSLYVHFLYAVIDSDSGENELSDMDYAIYELQRDSIFSAYRRAHTPAEGGKWHVMPGSRGEAGNDPFH